MEYAIFVLYPPCMRKDLSFVVSDAIADSRTSVRSLAVDMSQHARRTTPRSPPVRLDKVAIELPEDAWISGC